MVKVNSQYNVAAPDSLPVKVAGYMRRRMYERFVTEIGIAPGATVVDIGVTSDQTYEHSNYLVSWLPGKDRITAVGIDDASFLETVYPGVRFFKADGRNLPFDNLSFDYAHSSAVIEHVGSREQQAQLLREMWRVSRKGIFVTTPNRWFPLEFHTVLPFVHWLPPAAFRWTLSRLGREFFADERNLNLMTARQLANAAREAGIDRFRIDSVSLFGLPTNLILSAKR